MRVGIQLSHKKDYKDYIYLQCKYLINAINIYENLDLCLKTRVKNIRITLFRVYSILNIPRRPIN
jgi:hypothetical protein